MALSTRNEPRSPMRGEQLGQKFLTVSPYLSLPGNKRLQPSTTPRAWPGPSLQQALWLVTQGLSLPPTPLQLLSWESCSHKFCSTLNPDLPALGPRTQHPVSTHWLLLESDHLNPNPSLSATPWGWSSLSPQSVATAPPHLDPVPTVLFCTSLCLLQHSCLTSHTAGCRACSELLPLPTAPCSPEGCTQSLSRACCALRTVVLSFWRTLQCLTPTFVAVSSSARPQTLVVHQ